tara:strand:+ start:1015 stop:1425 length:411 start_codon:yes stop_codon:yes gene_type:complete
MPFVLTLSNSNLVWEVSNTTPSLEVIGSDKDVIEINEDTFNYVVPGDLYFANGYHISSDHIKFEDGSYRQLTEEECWINIRDKRESILKLCDWTVLPDSPLTTSKKTQWKTYRQQLRDLPTSNTNPFNISFPSEPS